LPTIFFFSSVVLRTTFPDDPVVEVEELLPSLEEDELPEDEEID
jgi:hypothetical protein